MFKIPVGPQSLVFSTAPEASVPQACTPDRKENHVYVHIKNLYYRYIPAIPT